MAKETPVNPLAIEAHPFQERGLPYKKICVGLTAMVLSTFVTIALMALLFGVKHRNTDPKNVLNRIMGHPRLQIDYKGEYAQFHDADLKQLNSFGWADKAKGLAHIPIENAMNMVVQKGLPAREAAQ